MSTGQARANRSSGYIGRVGALAVLLGVGGAIAALPATAAADTGSTDTGSRQAHGARGEAQDQTPADSAAPSARRSGHGPATPGSAASTAPNRAGHSARPAAAVPSPVVDGTATASTPASTDSAAVNLDSVPSVTVDSPTPSVVAAAQEIVTDAVSSTPAPAVMTSAAPRGALTATAINPLSWLAGGTDPAAPFAAPLAWAALAVSRREIATTSTAAPSAAVTTAAPAAALTGPLAAPGVGTALLTAAKQVVLAVASGGNIGVALQSAMTSLEADPAFAAVSLASVLADPGAAQALGQTASDLITGLAADATVRTAVGSWISSSLSAAMANYPGASGIASTVANAAVGLLADPAAANGLGALANSFVTSLLSQPGVSTTLTNAATQLISGLAGNDPAGAANAAW
ncbi:MAG: hypothetical protein ACOYBX_10045, partial [Mycobacterium sp.]